MISAKHTTRFIFLMVFVLTLFGPSWAWAQASQLNAAILPSSRAVAVNETATFFATIANSGASNVSNCRIAAGISAPASMSVGFQTTNASNELIGSTDTPVDIAAGAAQTFLVRVSSTEVFSGKAPLAFICDESTAFSFDAVNQPDFRASLAAEPDIVALGSTLSGDGIVNVDLGTRLGAISITAINVGASLAAETPADGPKGTSKPAANHAAITVEGGITQFSLDTGIEVFVCETDATGACLADLALSVTTNIGDGGSTFSAFAVKVDDPDRAVPFIPSYFRIKIVFRDSNGNVVGSTSAAMSSDPITNIAAKPVGVWEFFARDQSDPLGVAERQGVLVVPEDQGSVEGFIFRENLTPGESGLVRIPVVIDGQFDLDAQTLSGTMTFIGGIGSQATVEVPISLTYRNGQSMSIAYSNVAADRPQKAPKGKVSKPAAFDPANSAGTLVLSRVQPESAIGTQTLVQTLEKVFGPDNRANNAEGEGWILSEDFLFGGPNVVKNLKGKAKGCDASLDVSQFEGNSQQGVVFGSLTNCPATTISKTASGASVSRPNTLKNGSFSGPILRIIPNKSNLETKDKPLQDNALEAVFSDGFESGETFLWSQ
jgi:hypothetical protein